MTIIATIIQYSSTKLLKQLTSQFSVDANNIIGSNIKLINTQNHNEYFVGFIAKLIPSISNADTSLYSAIVLEGVNHLGVKQTITLSIESLEQNIYDSFDEMYYTNNLDEVENAAIKTESSNSLVINNANIQTFNIEDFSVGGLIAYKNAGEMEIRGIITSIDNKTQSLKILAYTNNKINTITLSLIEATNSNFDGIIIDPGYFNASIIYWDDSVVWDDNKIWEDHTTI